MTTLSVRVAAVDLGASSGRVMLGDVGPETLRLAEVARFPNGPVRTPDGLHWNVLELYARTVDGLREAVSRADGLAGVAIDSWAVDYGLLRDGRMLGMPFSYRDEERVAGVDRVHAVVPPDELYRRSGLQFLPFNTIYQLAADPWLGDAEHLLLIPDLLGYLLTGNRTTERTNASTTGLVDVHGGRWDDELLHRLGLPRRLFGELADPGEVVGPLLPHVSEAAGTSSLTVSTVGSHDTASAVVGVPMTSDDAAYISCGTWGLVGVELEKPVVTEAGRAANFTNERGVDGRVRFLTNVMGTWLLSESLRTWESQGRASELNALLDAARDVADGDVRVFDVGDPRFLPPGDMPERIRAWCVEHDVEPPRDIPALARSIVESLAQAFADALDAAAELTGRTVRTVHLVGGGARNALLCQAVADRAGRTVLAGPVEATALGNVLVQARTAGVLTGSLESLRGLVAATREITTFVPGD